MRRPGLAQGIYEQTTLLNLMEISPERSSVKFRPSPYVSRTVSKESITPLRTGVALFSLFRRRIDGVRFSRTQSVIDRPPSLSGVLGYPNARWSIKVSGAVFRVAD